MCPNDEDRMANNVEPHQTAPKSLRCFPELSVRKLRRIKVQYFLSYLFVNSCQNKRSKLAVKCNTATVTVYQKVMHGQIIRFQ